jgi:transposase
MILTPARRARDARFSEMWNALATCEEIGAALDIRQQTITNWRKRLRLPPRDRKAMAAARRPAELVERDRRIAEMWPDHTTTGIGKALGLSCEQVMRAVHRMGLPAKPPPPPSGKRRHVAKRRAPAQQVQKGGPVAPAPMVTLPPLASVTGSGHDNHAPDTRPPPSPSQGCVREGLRSRPEWVAAAAVASCAPCEAHPIADVRRPDKGLQAPPVRGPGAVRPEWLLMHEPWCADCARRAGP